MGRRRDDCGKRRRLASGGAQFTNNPKQLGLAVHNYVSGNNVLPLQCAYPSGSIQSWGWCYGWPLAIAPFLEQGTLFNAWNFATGMFVNAGATFVVPDFIDIGVTPIVRQVGQSAHAKQVSDAYNRKFAAMLDRVEREEPFDLVRWRFGDFVQDLIVHSEEFGFTNSTESCVAVQAAGRCDFDKFIFFNEQYPSAKVHELMGNAMAIAVLQRDRERARPATVVDR